MGTRAALAAWFEPRRSLYPWRGERDPYRVLVSEVMLQQTQATRVVPSYLVFVDRFPDLASLAAATRRDVLLAWAGLGYNRRAVALHEAARFRANRRNWKRCRELGRTRRQRWRRSPSEGPFRRSTRTSAGSWPGPG